LLWSKSGFRYRRLEGRTVPCRTRLDDGGAQRYHELAEKTPFGMNSQIEPRTKTEAKRGHGDDHLMCRTSLWGAAGFIGCVYFAWVSFGHITRNEFDWPHDVWTAATYVVWIVLLGTLTIDTQCLRERVFFGTLLINFFVGLGLTLWKGIPTADVRGARLATGALWTLGAVVSLTTVGRAGKTKAEAASAGQDGRGGPSAVR
jgi:hypothetical protein